MVYLVSAFILFEVFNVIYFDYCNKIKASIILRNKDEFGFDKNDLLNIRIYSFVSTLYSLFAIYICFVNVYVGISLVLLSILNFLLTNKRHDLCVNVHDIYFLNRTISTFDSVISIFVMVILFL